MRRNACAANLPIVGALHSFSPHGTPQAAGCRLARIRTFIPHSTRVKYYNMYTPGAVHSLCHSLHISPSPLSVPGLCNIALFAAAACCAGARGFGVVFRTLRLRAAAQRVWVCWLRSCRLMSASRCLHSPDVASIHRRTSASHRQARCGKNSRRCGVARHDPHAL